MTPVFNGELPRAPLHKQYIDPSIFCCFTGHENFENWFLFEFGIFYSVPISKELGTHAGFPVWLWTSRYGECYSFDK